MATDPRLANVARTVNEEIADRSIRNAALLERVKKAETRKIVQLMKNDVIPDLTEQIERRLGNINRRGFDTSVETTKRLQQLRDKSNQIVKDGTRSMHVTLREDMFELSKEQSGRTIRMLNDVVPGELGLNFAQPSVRTLRSIVTSRPMQGKLLRTWFKGLEVATQTELQRQINIGLATGEPTQTITRRVRDVLKTTTRNAEAITRTAVNHVSTHAREETYKENEEAMEGVKWVSTLDTRTTFICISLDGRVFDVGEGPRPPAHVGCRSTTTPVLKGWQEFGFESSELTPGTRASMNGQVPADLTYGQWLKQQSKSTQNEVLGKARAELFRSGKIDARDLVDTKLRPLTVEQLKQKS